MAKINPYIKSATLIETVTAMVIVMLSIALAFVLLTRINTGMNFRLLTDAQVRVSYVMHKTMADSSFINETLSYDYITIKKEIDSTDLNLKRLTITAYDRRSKQLVSRERLVEAAHN